MSFFDWLSVLPGPRPEMTTATYRHLLALTCYRITTVPDTMYQTKYPGPRRFDQDPTHWPSDPRPTPFSVTKACTYTNPWKPFLQS